jgi:hypothetical protein
MASKYSPLKQIKTIGNTLMYGSTKGDSVDAYKLKH